VEQIDLIKKLFVYRSDVYAIQLDDGRYVKRDEPLTDEVLMRHLRGELTVGIYQLNGDKVKWMCFDIDRERAVAEEIFKFLRSDEKLKDSVALEETGGRGQHVWTFFDPPILAKAARAVGKIVMEAIGVTCELFPKQSGVSEDGFGNLVKLPLGLHRKYRRWSFFVEPISLEEVKPAELTVDEQIELAVREADEVEEFRNKIFWRGCPGFEKINRGVEEGFRNEAAFFKARVYVNVGVPADEALSAMRVWNEKNKPPMSDVELKNVVVSVYRKRYPIGLKSLKENDILKPFCQGCKNCIFLYQPQKKRELSKVEIIKPIGGTI
jgi:hypothetical protein